MNTKSQIGLGLCLAMFLALSSCKKDEVEDPVVPNEEEIITTLNFTLSPSGGGDDILLSFVDLDADGPDSPVITVSDSLAANTEYAASLVLLNETETPAESVNTEIMEEAEEHQFFFLTTDVNINVSYDDMDADGNPLGLSTTLSAGDASEGTLTVILRHEPDKGATGVADGDITNAGGETDIEATFDVVIQ